MIIVDEGFRFKAARILKLWLKTVTECPNLFVLSPGRMGSILWTSAALRLDPAGAFRSAAVEAWCDRHAVHLDIVPGEAHWKIGDC